nr:ribosomal protein S3 [Uronema sp. CCAP 334/1]
MGQKIHPYGYRVGITQPHSARWFANSYQYPQYVFEDFLLRQSLFKDLPVENLPRKRSDDKSETKLVQIKIERLIRNTIKIKLYMTNPENFDELFEQNNSSKLSKKDNGNLNQIKGKTNKDANLLFLGVQKKLLNKRILQLKLLKLKNMQYKVLTMQNLIDSKTNTNSSNKFFPSVNLGSSAFINTKNIDLSNSYTSVSLISGLKELLQNAQSTNMLPNQSLKLKYLFYFIQLKISFFKNVDRQISFYQTLQKQKLINSTLNQTTVTLKLKQLKALQQQIKTLVQYLNTTIETVKEKLILHVEKFTSNFVTTKVSKETYFEKCSTLINILKIKSKASAQKNNYNKLESLILNEKIAEIKLRWFENLNSPSSSKLNELKVQFQKQKLLTILTKFKVSLKFYNLKIENYKKFILSTLLILAKVTGSESFKNGNLANSRSNLTEIKICLSKSLLIINKFNNCFCKNSITLKERLISKINSLSLLHENLKENLSVRKIISLLADSSLQNYNLNFPVLSKYLIKIVNSSLNKVLFKTNQNLVLDGFSNEFGKYTYLLKNKVINSNVGLLSSFQENLLEKKSFYTFNNYLHCLKKEYLHTSIKSIRSLKQFKEKNLSTKLYKFSLNLLTIRSNLNKILEIKIKSLLSSNKLHTVKIFSNYLKINTLIINQLSNWVTILQKKLTENSSINLELLRTRIYKINCYLKKLLNQFSEAKKSNERSFKLSFRIEKNLILLNYNILKQKLIFGLLKMQRSQISSQCVTDMNVAVDFNLVAQKLALQSSKLQKRILELENQFRQDKNDGELSLQAQTQMAFSNTFALKTQLQTLLKQNYQNNFVVLQSRRKVYNAVINRFGGRRNPYFTQNTNWKNPFETNGNNVEELPLGVFPGETLRTNYKFSDKNNTLISLLDAVKEKIYERKPLKLRETRKQKFLAKKTIKKKLKQFLILLALQNNYTNLASLKNIYNVENLSQVCDNFTTLQTLPKVSVIELVKVRQPKQYAVCLANFIVENLEKRFSFRSTMKKAAEQAMSTANVKGIKIQISGRLNGAEIARTEWLRDGVVPLQTLRANIDYSYKTAKTIYGILGVKVWLFKESSINS